MCSMWVGASLLGSLRTFWNMGITRRDQNEVGPAVLQRKIHLKISGGPSRRFFVGFFFFLSANQTSWRAVNKSVQK